MSKVAPARPENGSRMIWIQLLAGPVIWAVHFLIVYMLTEAICRAGVPGPEVRLAGVPLVNAIVVVITVVAVVAIVLFALKSYRAWRSFDRDRRVKEEIQEDAQWSEEPGEFLYFSGLLLSVLFAAVTLMVGIPALFLQPC